MTSCFPYRSACLWLMLAFVPVFAAPNAKDIERLVKQLGDNEFDKREAASKALAKIGEPALEALRKAAASSEDAEVRLRAACLVEAIENDLPYLFNGKDLTGWEGLKGAWKVQEGAIIGTSFPAGRQLSTFLCTRRKFKDFELRFQARIRGENNSAVHIRSDLYDRSHYWLNGVKCDLGSGSPITTWGTLVMYDGKGGSILKRATPEEMAKIIKPNDFNQCVIRCVGQHVTVKVNGVITMDADVPQLASEGVIALHLRKGNPIEVAFKEIQIKDLSRR